MKSSKTLLNERLKALQCETIPAWLPDRLLPLVEKEVASTNDKMGKQLNRRIARTITTKSIAKAFLAGPAVGEGSKGEALPPPLLPTVNKAQ